MLLEATLLMILIALLCGAVVIALVVRHERREIAEWQRISEHLGRDARMRNARGAARWETTFLAQISREN